MNKNRLVHFPAYMFEQTGFNKMYSPFTFVTVPLLLRDRAADQHTYLLSKRDGPTSTLALKHSPAWFPLWRPNRMWVCARLPVWIIGGGGYTPCLFFTSLSLQFHLAAFRSAMRSPYRRRWSTLGSSSRRGSSCRRRLRDCEKKSRSSTPPLSRSTLVRCRISRQHY